MLSSLLTISLLAFVLIAHRCICALSLPCPFTNSLEYFHIEKNAITGVIGEFCDNFYFDGDVEGKSVVADCPDEVECSCCTSCCQPLPGTDDCIVVEQRPNV